MNDAVISSFVARRYSYFTRGLSRKVDLTDGLLWRWFLWISYVRDNRTEKQQIVFAGISVQTLPMIRLKFSTFEDGKTDNGIRQTTLRAWLEVEERIIRTLFESLFVIAEHNENNTAAV